MTVHAQVTQFQRQQFLNGECTPNQYYSQFITPTGLGLVQRSDIFQTLKISSPRPVKWLVNW